MKNTKTSNGEDNILNLIGKYFPNTHIDFLMGRGDDCALLNVPVMPSDKKDAPLLAITSDIFAQNAHFRTHYFSPFEIGYKALAVNISDLASNGARPNSFSLNLTLTDKQDFAWLEEFFKGMSSLANLYGMGLSGGDLAKVPSSSNLSKDHFLFSDNFDNSSGLNIGICAMGDYGHGGLPLLRHHTFSRENTQPIKAGDIIFIIGHIGLARVGLTLLERAKNQSEIDKAHKEYPDGVKAHLMPKPLVEHGLFLSHFAMKYHSEFCLYCMDISDGLMRDLPRILGRQGLIQNISKKDNTPILGADVLLDEKTLHKDVLAFCHTNKLDPCLFAYEGGEDYGLLGICSKNAWETLKEEITNDETLNFSPIQKIGIVTEKKLTLNAQVISENGFDHFKT